MDDTLGRSGRRRAAAPEVLAEAKTIFSTAGQPASPEPFGLIAGQGQLPIQVARGIKRAGHRLIVVGLRDQADPALAGLADQFAWAGITRLGRWIRLLRRAGVSRAILIGRVSKRRMFAPLRLLR